MLLKSLAAALPAKSPGSISGIVNENTSPTGSLTTKWTMKSSARVSQKGALLCNCLADAPVNLVG